MRHSLSLFALAGLLAGIPVGAADEARPIHLFNGKDLKGWKVYFKDGKKDDTCFKAEPGLRGTFGAIHCKGAPLGYIITEKEYGDYKLTLEWKWDEGAKKVKVPNSGVLLHVTGDDAIWPKCIEAQLMSGNAGDFWLMGGATLQGDESRKDKKNARHYFKIKTEKPVEKPLGEWNKYEIVCKGDTITLMVNGVKLNEGMKASVKKGKIALQSEGAPIWFRNIVLTPLE